MNLYKNYYLLKEQIWYMKYFLVVKPSLQQTSNRHSLYTEMFCQSKLMLNCWLNLSALKLKTTLTKTRLCNNIVKSLNFNIGCS